MLTGNLPPSRILFFGLTENLGVDLGRTLLEHGHVVSSYPLFPASRALDLIEQSHADLVFCASTPDYYKLLIQAIQEKHPGLPLVVVSRHPDTSAWVDALEAGATDYCVPPFESISMRWVLESALTSCRAPA